MNTEEPFREDPSDELAQRIAYLINGYIRKKLTVSEHKELDEWVSASMKNQELFEELTDPVNIKRWIYRKEGIDSEAALERVKTKLGFKQEFQFYKQRRIWPYLVVAAAVLGVIFYSIHLYRRAAILRSPVVVIHQDLPPGGKHAILTLNNGRNILLDTVKSGETYLGKTLTFKFNSYIDGKTWDGPNANAPGDKLTSTVSVTGNKNS